MAFYSINIIFNNISSESFGLKMVKFESIGLLQNAFGGGITPITEQIRRRPSVYLYGTQPSEPLEFNMELVSEEEIDAYSVSAISQWLFGKQSYGWLQIEQPTYEGLFFKCLLINPQIISVGNINYGFSFTVHLDSSYVYTDEYTYNYTISTPNQTITFNNMSNYDGYIYPYITFTTNPGIPSFSIKNVTDNNRTFSFTNISGSETISTDNDLQIITSSTGLNRLNSFNFKFLRLVRGWNTLVFNGNSSVTMRLRMLKKIGG